MNNFFSNNKYNLNTKNTIEISSDQILEILKLSWDRFIFKKDIVLKDQKLKDNF